MTTTSEGLSPLHLPGGRGWRAACHHTPPGATRAAVLICAPPGPESDRTHRALRQLAQRLAADGAHVLRFDWTGTGDSAGDFAEVRADDWRTDAVDALAELLARSGQRRATVIGLRLGATLALDALGAHPAVATIIAWEPVLDGAEQLRQWSTAQRTFCLPFGFAVSERPIAGLTVVDEALGYPLADALVTDLAALAIAPPRCRLVVVADQPEALTAQAQRLGAGAARRLPCPPLWRQEPSESVVPAEAVRGLAALVAEVQP